MPDAHVNARRTRAVAVMLSIILSILLDSHGFGKRSRCSRSNERGTTEAQRHPLRFWTPALVGAGRSDVFGDGPKLFSGGSSVVGPGPSNSGPSAAAVNHPWRVFAPDLCGSAVIASRVGGTTSRDLRRSRPSRQWTPRSPRSG